MTVLSQSGHKTVHSFSIMLASSRPNIENIMIGRIKSSKVLECDGETAVVYYVCDNNTVGNVLKYQKDNNQWEEISWDCVWSKQGNADEMIWPYWHHRLIYVWL